MPRRARSDRRELGLEGEARAARFLESRGYRIVARNVRADRVEIDLIARRGPLLVFVEVKTRRGAAHGLAAEAVDTRKQRRLRHGAHAWLAGDPSEARGTRRLRFDVITCRCDAPAAEATRSAAARTNPRPQNETTAPEAARWSFEHWQAAF